MERNKLFLQVLYKLNEKELLNDLILIGGWCLSVYKEYFNNSEKVPIKRTLDIDFLIPIPPKLKHKANPVEILKELDFRIQYNRINNFTKFVHPDLEIEFLMNQKGSGINNFYEVKELSVTAVQLRYLSLLENNTIKIKYHDIIIKVPEPSAFTLHKYIVSGRRKKEEKANKDLYTAKEMTDFLLELNKEKEKIKNIFFKLNKSWQKTIIEILKDEHRELYEFLYK